jgi:hypothetical protein
MDLRLYDENLRTEFAAQFFGYRYGLPGRYGNESFLHGNTMRLQNGFSLVFVDVHDKFRLMKMVIGAP